MNLPCLEVDFSNLFRADWNIEALSRVVIAYTAVKGEIYKRKAVRQPIAGILDTKMG